MPGKYSILSPIPRSALAFRPEFLDFERGIRVGNLDDNERITRLLKVELEALFRQPFVTERWGRGVFWAWIGFLPRSNRAAKPLSGKVSFGCSKFFVMVDTEDKEFKCGLQVERGYLKAPPEYRQCELKEDWDWNRLVRSLRSGSPVEREISRLVKREGFRLHAGGWETASVQFTRTNLPGASRLRKLLVDAPADRWAGFQLYYPMNEREVCATPGIDLFEAILAVFRQVVPVMNQCMQITLELDA
jgi:hypothetical protein